MDAIEEFGLLVKALTREADRRINDLLRPLGITTSQAEALQLLDRYGPLSLGELGTLLIAEGGIRADWWIDWSPRGFFNGSPPATTAAGSRSPAPHAGANSLTPPASARRSSVPGCAAGWMDST